MWKALRGDKTDNVPRVDGMTDSKATKVLADPAKLQAVMDDPTLKAQLERNLTLIRFMTGLHETIQYTHPAPALDKARDQFRDFKFYSMINDTAWRNYTKTFSSLLSSSGA